MEKLFIYVSEEEAEAMLFAIKREIGLESVSKNRNEKHLNLLLKSATAVIEKLEEAEKKRENDNF